MGHVAIHAPCCLAGALTEGEHDPDCDDHPGNVAARARRGLRFDPPPVIRFGPPPAPCTSGAVTVHAGDRYS